MTGGDMLEDPTQPGGWCKVVFRTVAAAVILTIVAGASTSQAHIPPECAVRTQTIEGALEGEATARELLDMLVGMTDAETHWVDEQERVAALERTRALTVNFLRQRDNTKHHFLVLLHCIMDPPSVALP